MTGEIVAIRKVECADEFVYNLEVEANDSKDKNYFADGVLVSNCQRMSESSFDALLKLLEEPPRGVRFVLCTTDVQKVRPAVQSRCQRHDFKKVFWSQIAERLGFIAQKEKVEVEPGALQICAKVADGGVRNAVRNLDALIDYAGGKKITQKDAEELFGTIDDELYAKLFDQIVGGKDGKANATEGYKIITQLSSSGVDSSAILAGIEEYLRALMVCCTCTEVDLSSQSQNVKMYMKQHVIRCKEKVIKIEDCRRELNHVKESLSYNFSIEAALFGWLIRCIHLLRI